MPGKSRLNVAESVAHIIARSLSSEVLFDDDEDRSVVEDSRFRISRFEKEGRSLDGIAEVARLRYLPGC
jgi:hypothetical protein